MLSMTQRTPHLGVNQIFFWINYILSEDIDWEKIQIYAYLTVDSALCGILLLGIYDLFECYQSIMVLFATAILLDKI